MSELYVAFRDGYTHAMVGAGAWTGRVDTPIYMREETPVRTGEDLYRDFGHLIRPRTDN